MEVPFWMWFGYDSLQESAIYASSQGIFNTMSESVRLTIQVIVSLAIIYAGFWWMWRIPGKPVMDSAAAPLLAFASVWTGLASVVMGATLWWVEKPDLWVPIHVLIWAFSMSLAGLALWTYRHTPPEQRNESIQLQCLQARIGLIFSLLAVVLWYAFILTHKAPLTPIGG